MRKGRQADWAYSLDEWHCAKIMMGSSLKRLLIAAQKDKSS